MARPLRIEYEGAFYHITARGNDRKRVFFSKADYNSQIADMFGGVSCSAIAKANERFLAKIMKDRALRKTVDKISRKMSYVNG